MSSPRYPLYNIRKNAYGVWQQIHETGETVVVPGSASNYCIRLKEVPDNGSVHAKPLITGLTRAELYPPSASQFWVNYSTGEVVFSSELEGQTLAVDYWKRGSLVDVDDINLLYNRIIEFDRDPNNLDDGYEVGTLCVNTSANEYFICVNNTENNAIWIPRGGGIGGGTSGTSGTSALSGISPAYIHLQTIPASTWTIIHNKGSQYPVVEVYDTSNNIIIPYSILAQDENTVIISFNTELVEGRVVLTFTGSMEAGTSGTSGVSGTSGTSGTSPIGGYYHTSFDNTSLSAGILTVNHDLGNMFVVVAIYDEMNRFILPQEINLTTANIAEIDLSTYGSINGTWNVVVTF